mgnify:CR=1 FL=1
MAKKKTEEEVVLDGPMSPEDKKRVMRAAIAALKKTHPGIVFDPTEQNKNINWISTGSAKLDMAISDQGGGLPRGRIVEVYGANSCGKTTQFILACANAQRQYTDQPVLYIDVEHSLNIEYAQKLGLDTHPDKWILVQPDSAEEALDILVKMSETGLFSVIVLDSIAGLISEKQWEKDAGIETHSEPQLASSGSIEAKLESWSRSLPAHPPIPFAPADGAGNGLTTGSGE